MLTEERIRQIIDTFADSLCGEEAQLILENWKNCVDEDKLKKSLKEILGEIYDEH